VTSCQSLVPSSVPISPGSSAMVVVVVVMRCEASVGATSGVCPAT
jgi:hypothetical protein